MTELVQSCRTFYLILLAVGMTGGMGFAQGVIEGRVILPEAKSAPLMVKRYSVVTQGGVTTVTPSVAVVYLEGTFPRGGPPPRRQMVQKDYLFVPALLPIQTGTTVDFPNLDDAYHNVFSYSSPKRFDLGRYRPDEKPVPFQVFDKPGLVALHCEIHEHMRGIILVLDTPHFVTTDTDGKFRLAGLPAGKFKLKAWLNNKTTLEKAVEIKSSATLRVDFP